jgi:hypothetical protein
MYLNHIKKRNYPVMSKLYNVLHEGFINNAVVAPLSMDHIQPYISENQINKNFLNMMGELGQVQFLQRFTVKVLQLSRVINFFFEQVYKKEIWKDAFSSDPDEKYTRGFSKYLSITAQNVITTLEREKKLSQIYDFIEKFKTGGDADSLAADHYRFLWDQFPDIMRPYLPVNGTPEQHIQTFFEYDEIKDIPEFHIISSILYPLFESYGIQDIEFGLKDDILQAAETAASYLPYCHFYVTATDVAELFIINGINDLYDVKVYDNNESSLYKLIDDISKSLAVWEERRKKDVGKSIFQRDDNQKYF